MNTDKELLEFVESAIRVSEDELIKYGKFELFANALVQHKKGDYSLVGFGDPFDMESQVGHDAFREQFYEMLSESVKKEKYIKVAVVSIGQALHDNNHDQQCIRVAYETHDGINIELHYEFHIHGKGLLLGNPKLTQGNSTVFR